MAFGHGFNSRRLHQIKWTALLLSTFNILGQKLIKKASILRFLWFLGGISPFSEHKKQSLQ